MPSAETEFLLLQAAHDIVLEAKVRKLKHCVTLMIYQSFCKLANFSSKGYDNGKRAYIIYYIYQKHFKHRAILQPNQRKPKFDQVFFIYIQVQSLRWEEGLCDVKQVASLEERWQDFLTVADLFS